MLLNPKSACKVLRALTGKIWFYSGRILQSRYMHSSRVVLVSNDLTTQGIKHTVHVDGNGPYVQIDPQSIEA